MSNKKNISGDPKSVADQTIDALAEALVNSESSVNRINIEIEEEIATSSGKPITYEVGQSSQDVVIDSSDVKASEVNGDSVSNGGSSVASSDVGDSGVSSDTISDDKSLQEATAKGYNPNSDVGTNEAPQSNTSTVPNQTHDNSEEVAQDGLQQTPQNNGVNNDGDVNTDVNTAPNSNGNNQNNGERADDQNAATQGEGLHRGDEGLPEKTDPNVDPNKEVKPDENESKNGNANTTDPNLGKNEQKEQQTAPKENASKPEGSDVNPNTQGRAPSQSGQVPNKNNSAGTDVANRNLEHNKRMQAGKNAENGGGKPSSTSSSASKDKKGNTPKANNNKKTKGKASGKASNKISKILNAKDALKNPFKTAWDFIKNKLLMWLLAHPVVLVVILVILLLFFILLFMIGMDNFGSGSGNGQVGTRCNYELNGVLSTGTLNANGLQVELVNCQATEGNYTVLETVDFEKYVLGVALAEIGPGASDEALKAQIVASRNFALTRNSGMCPGNPDNCFYGYNASTGKIRMRACENDQVYWDYEKTSYREDRGAVSIYSPEINSGTVWKNPLSEERKAQVLALADEVKGVVLLDDNGNVVKTPYNSTVSTNFSNLAAEGKTYKEILEAQYGVSSYNNAECSFDGEIFYGDYVLSSDGNTILHQRLDTFLANNGSSLESFSGLIAKNVDKAGYGTRAGVVTAAVTLIGELGNKYGVKLPYYWSGGHYDGVVVGALGYWGSTECHIYANDQHYNYCGFDCSGFVPWAIKNGGYNMAQMLASDFQNIPGAEKVTLRSEIAVLQPGDLLESSGHIVLVVGVDEEKKQYICAEASGNQYGVWFTRRSFKDDGYWGVRMDGYYNNPSNIRRS